MAKAELRAIASLDGRKFEAGVRRVSGSTSKFQRQLSRLPAQIGLAFSIGAVVNFGRQLLAMADDLNTTAQNAGITMQQMLTLQNAMAESGIKADQMSNILSRITIAQDGVIDGNERYIKALDKLGISAREFISLDTEQVIELLSKRYGEAGGSAQAFGAIVDLFGRRQGPAMAEVLQRINDRGLEEFRKGTEKASASMLELAMTTDTLEKATNQLTIWLSQAVWGFKLLWAVMRVISPVTNAIKLFEKLAAVEILDESMRKPFKHVLDEYDEVRRQAMHKTGTDKIAEANQLAFKESQKRAREEARKTEDDRLKKVEDTERRIEVLRDKQLAGKFGAQWEIENEERKLLELRERGATIINELERLEIIEEILKQEEKIADLKERAAKEEERRAREEERRQENIAKALEKQADIEAKYQQQTEDILSGKGISTPEQANIDWAQKVGMVVGGVAGVGNQQVRIAERQLAIDEALLALSRDTINALDDIESEIRRLGEE